MPSTDMPPGDPRASARATVEAAWKAVHARFAPHAGAARGVPGLLVGTGPSFDALKLALRPAVRGHRCVLDGVPAAREWLRREGWSPAELPLSDGVPPTVALHLALRAIGCDPIVLVGVAPACIDGVVCASNDERRLDWAAELGPFRTIEDIHLASTRFDDPQAEGLDLLAEAIDLERGLGLRTLTLDPGASIAGATPATVAEALPARAVDDPWRARVRALRSTPPEASRTAEHSARADGAPNAASSAHPGPPALVASLVDPPGGRRPRSGPLSIEVRSPRRVAAVVAIDPDHGGTGVPRHLDSEFGSGTVLAATLERLGQVRGIQGIVLLVPDGFDPRPLFDPARIGLPVEIESCGASVHPPEQRAIRAARLWSDTAWRGGIGGATIWDEIVAPRATLEAIERRSLDGALCCGADWPLVMVEERGGCDDLVERFRASTTGLDLAAAPAPPGLGACVVGRPLLESLARRSGPVLIGDRWRTARPQLDPGCVVPVDRIRRSMVRACFDSMRAKLRLRRAIEPLAADGRSSLGVAGLGAWSVVEALEHQFFHLPPAFAPQHLIIELNTGRRASGSASPHRNGSIQRPAMTERILERILEEVEPPRDVVITFGHVGDPLWHPQLPRFVRLARQAGARGIHVRTELLADAARIDALLDARPDAISVDLHAVSEPTYRALMGINRFDRVIANLERLVASRGGAEARLRLPHLAVRLQRRAESAGEQRAFVEAWAHRVSSAIIEGVATAGDDPESNPGALIPCEIPAPSIHREAMRRMVILSDGRVPFSELDLRGEHTIGSVLDGGVFEIWRDLMPRRRQLAREVEPLPLELRWWQP